MERTAAKQKANTNLTEAQQVFKKEVQAVRERVKTNLIDTAMLQDRFTLTSFDLCGPASTDD